MKRESVWATGIAAFALAGACYAEAPPPAASLLDQGINTTQQRLPLDAMSTSNPELPIQRRRDSGEFPLITPLPERSIPRTICACPPLKLEPQPAPLVG
jgi:hypothetical protein